MADAGADPDPKPKRASTEKVAAAAVTPAAIEDAVSAAEGTRTASKWIASSLGAIPGIAVLASIVRAPGDSGFDSSDLAIGVFLAAAGAILAILAFAHVLAPAAIEEEELHRVDLRRIPGHPFPDYRRLAAWIEAQWRLRADTDLELSAAEELAAGAAAEAAAAEAELARLRALSTEDPDDEGLKGALVTAKSTAERLRSAASEQQASLALLGARANSADEELSRGEDLRANIYRLAGADEVRRRYEMAAGLSVFAVALVAGGVILLGLAPQPKAEDPSVALLTLKPNQAGKEALGCQAASLSAIKIGGDQKTPVVITLPSAACPTARQLEFATEGTPLGEAEAAE